MRDPLPFDLYLILLAAGEAMARCAGARMNAEGHRAFAFDRVRLRHGPEPLRPNTSRALTHDGHTALRFARSAARPVTPVPGLAFAIYWMTFRTLDAAEARTLPRHEEGDCPWCAPGCRSEHECSMARRRVVFRLEERLRIARGVYESARRPPAEGARFYATARSPVGDTAWLAGPYAAHEDALRVLPEAQKLARTFDKDAWTYAFGTAARVSDESGVLNPYLPAE